MLYPGAPPYAGDNVMVGHLVGCYGAMDRYLGMAASVLGEWERAEEHFRAALALNTRLGARTWLAHTAYWYARMLLARGSPGDDDARRQRAARLALGLGREIGLPSLVRRGRRARRLGGRRGALPTVSRAARPRSSSSLPAGARTARSAGCLHISEHTAANHIRSILRKTRCANRTEAAGYALRRGLVPDGAALPSSACRST